MNIKLQISFYLLIMTDLLFRAVLLLVKNKLMKNNCKI